MDRQVEAFAQGYLMLGFVLSTPFFALRAAHHERPCRNPGELHADGVGPERPDWLNAGGQQAPQTVFEFAPIRNFN